MKNLKYIILILLIFSFGKSFFSQIEKGEGFLSIKGGYINIDDFTPRGYGGIEFDLLAWEKVGIHYSLLFGDNYFHMPIAPIGGFLAGIAVAATENDSTGENRVGAGLIVGLLTSIIPEGISLNIKVNDQIAFAPYISPLQFEYIRNDSKTKDDSFAGGAIGLRYHHYYYNQQFRISPYMEYKIHYSKNTHPGISAGLNLSYKVKKKSKKSFKEQIDNLETDQKEDSQF